MSDPRPVAEAGAVYAFAAALAAIDPAGLGGILLRGRAGPQRDHHLAVSTGLLPRGAPVRRLPAHIAEARLIGGLDLAATLGAGRPILQAGLLVEAGGGLVVIPMAERLPLRLAALLAATLDTGAVTIEREGFATRAATRFGVLAFDESIEDEEQPPTILAERLAFHIDIDDVPSDEIVDVGASAADIAAARARLAAVVLPDPILDALAKTALALGVPAMRPLLFAAAAARAAAALAGDAMVDENAATLAATLVLAPRATTAPAAPASAETDDPGSGDNGGDPPGASEDASEQSAQTDPREMAERVIAAAAAAIPADLLTAKARRRSSPGTPILASGRAGAATASLRRGRPIGARPGSPDGRARLDLIETLRAAAPWQRLRGRVASSPTPARIEVRRDDLRIARLKERRQTTTIFVVDASGSAALHRLAEAKGAVELLLAQSYTRRDQVALISFGGKGVDLLLAPTRSLARAKRGLAGLPGGGGTPLAAAIDAASALAVATQRRGDTPTLVFLTDGQANIARDGTGGRAVARGEALAAATQLRARALHGLVIDMAPRPHPQARDLAQAMGATYFPLPLADAAAVTRAVRSQAVEQKRPR